MPKTDPRIDAYIAKAKPFAQPILKHLRKVVHAACPGVQEEMKWSFPHFTYNGMLCSMAAFKAHCSFGFWKGALLHEHGLPAREAEGMGQFGRITSVKELPTAATITRLVKLAAKLNDDGVKAPKRKVTPVKDRVVSVPPALQKALKANKKARAAFEAMPYSHKKEYVEWIAEAKMEATRDRRVAQAIEMIEKGKSRNWKY